MPSKYQLMSLLARVLAMIDAEPPLARGEIGSGAGARGDAGAAEVARAVKAGETIGAAFVDPEQVSLFDEGDWRVLPPTRQRSSRWEMTRWHCSPGWFGKARSWPWM